jgi:hydrogenase maturation factor
MCTSRFHQVLDVLGDDMVRVVDVDGTSHRISLLALDGPTPDVGEWLVVHSGYAIDRADAADAESVANVIRRAMATTRSEELS